MTAQIGDKYRYNGGSYTIVAMSERMKFRLSDYGITPAWICTACWAGYWCEYNITPEGIFLDKLFINSADGTYPPINGVTPSENEDRMRYMGHEVYESLNLRMPFTGKILLGADFLMEYYIHMGYQQAWAYETLVEFIFEDGILKETVDHSKTAAAIRKKISDDREKSDEYDSYESIVKFVEDAFSLDYRTKAWWL